MASQLYRNSTLGNALQESIDELLQCGKITPELGIKILLLFDKFISMELIMHVRSNITFKAFRMDTYRFYNDVWTFVLSDVTFKKEKEEFIKIDKIKIVACDGNSEKANSKRNSRE